MPKIDLKYRIYAFLKHSEGYRVIEGDFDLEDLDKSDLVKELEIGRLPEEGEEILFALPKWFAEKLPEEELFSRLKDAYKTLVLGVPDQRKPNSPYLPS